MSPARSRLALAVAVGACSLLPLAAADPVQVQPDPSTRQLRVWVGSPATWDLEEEIGDQRWVWKGEAHTPGRLAVEGLWARITPSGGALASLGVEATRHDITPHSYTYAGVDFANTSPNRLRATTLAVSLSGGYQYGLTGDWSRGHQFWAELAPIVSGGPVWVSTDVRDDGGGYSKSQGTGWHVRYGLRLGAFVSERRVLAGVTVEYGRSYGEAEIDTIGGRTSTLTYESDGLTWGGVLGYAF